MKTFKQFTKEAREQLIAPKTVYGSDNGKMSKRENSVWKVWSKKKVGDTVAAEVGAPGKGKKTWRITKIDSRGVHGIEESSVKQFINEKKKPGEDLKVGDRVKFLGMHKTSDDPSAIVGGPSRYQNKVGVLTKLNQGVASVKFDGYTKNQKMNVKALVGVTENKMKTLKQLKESLTGELVGKVQDVDHNGNTRTIEVWRRKGVNNFLGFVKGTGAFSKRNLHNPSTFVPGKGRKEAANTVQSAVKDVNDTASLIKALKAAGIKGNWSPAK